MEQSVHAVGRFMVACIMTLGVLLLVLQGCANSSKQIEQFPIGQEPFSTALLILRLSLPQSLFLG